MNNRLIYKETITYKTKKNISIKNSNYITEPHASCGRVRLSVHDFSNSGPRGVLMFQLPVPDCLHRNILYTKGLISMPLYLLSYIAVAKHILYFLYKWSCVHCWDLLNRNTITYLPILAMYTDNVYNRVFCTKFFIRLRVKSGTLLNRCNASQGELIAVKLVCKQHLQWYEEWRNKKNFLSSSIYQSVWLWLVSWSIMTNQSTGSVLLEAFWGW